MDKEITSIATHLVLLCQITSNHLIYKVLSILLTLCEF
jgi:hypothetical protein